MWIMPSLFDGPNSLAVVDEWTFRQYVAVTPFPSTGPVTWILGIKVTTPHIPH